MEYKYSEIFYHLKILFDNVENLHLRAFRSRCYATSPIGRTSAQKTRVLPQRPTKISRSFANIARRRTSGATLRFRREMASSIVARAGGKSFEPKFRANDSSESV